MREASPEERQFQNLQAGALAGLGRSKVAAGKPSEARGDIEKAIEIARGLLQENLEAQEAEEAQDLLIEGWKALGDSLAALGDHAAAARAARELPAVLPGRWEAAFEAACLLSRASSLAGKDAGLPEADRKKIQDSCAGEAVGMIEESLRRGFQDASRLKSEKALDPLLEREDFQKLLQKLVP